MRRTEIYVILGTLGVAAVVALAGCGGTSSISGNVPWAPAVTLGTDSVDLGVPPDDGLIERWMDVADTTYTTDCGGNDFTTSYGYAQANVSASFVTPAEQLVITLNGGGLKPNFAYQVKLEGVPEDPDANAILASLGRQWGGTGYLVFGYFVTDENGNIVTCASSTWNADTSIPVDSSYHVLWKVSQRPPRRADGPIITHSIAETCFGYDGNGTGNTVQVYAEWERSRPRPGALVLPDGPYTCLLRLSEEAFHMTDEYGNMIYGWKTVLDAPVYFEIQSGGGPGPGSHDVAVTEIGVSPRIPIADQSAAVTVTVANEGTEPEDTDVSLSDTSDGSAIIVPSSPQPVSLSPGGSTTVEFTWTPSQAGFHVLEARGGEVPGETDTGDNVKSKKVKVR